MGTGAIIGLTIGVAIACLLIGTFIGFKIAGKYFKKNLNENPLINEQQIRAMYAQMGRKPSEQQVKAVMNSYRNNVNKKK
jgi:uncharacterized protein YneF (UPF0154 family)